MKALVLAAGLGKRMRPLTLETPKPLLPVADFRLIDWAIAGLVKAGVTDLVINAAHLSHTFLPALGTERLGAKLTYSIEGVSHDQALETLGGIVKALPQLSDGIEPFIVVAGDIATDFDFTRLVACREALMSGELDAHLVLVPNPDYHRAGDMGLEAGLATRHVKTHTFSSIGIYSPRIFEGLASQHAKLFPWLFDFVDAGRVTAEIYDGFWENVGTPDALAALKAKCLAGTAPMPSRN